EARCRTHRRIGVALGQAHAALGDAVDVGRGEIAPAVARQVGIAEVVGHDEDDVGRLRHVPFPHTTAAYIRSAIPAPRRISRNRDSCWALARPQVRVNWTVPMRGGLTCPGTI